MECKECLSVSKIKPIFIESRIFEGKYWIIEHAYPTKYKGWFVIVLKQHKEALHELTKEEFNELGVLQENLIRALHKTLNCQKEYCCCFAEGEGFKHIHFHIIAVPGDLPSDLRGIHIFSMIKVTPEESLPKDEILKMCKPIKKELGSLIKKIYLKG